MDGLKRMTNVKHAHRLMDFIKANPHLNTLEEIKESFTKKFGDVSFTNCTNNVYTFDEIFEFLFQRNKVVTLQEGLRVNENNRCKDD